MMLGETELGDARPAHPRKEGTGAGQASAHAGWFSWKRFSCVLRRSAATAKLSSTYVVVPTGAPGVAKPSSASARPVECSLGHQIFAAPTAAGRSSRQSP